MNQGIVLTDTEGNAIIICGVRFKQGNLLVEVDVVNGTTQYVTAAKNASLAETRDMIARYLPKGLNIDLRCDNRIKNL